MKEKYRKIKEIVKKELSGADAGHDLKHVMRVYSICLKLTRGMKNINLEKSNEEGEQQQ